ncbi:YybS family protein [Paenibacillus vietnamensis]|uniref:YybS family protein n=1 Tax=Paenibacillus vietnamensis TaxID=2590547 RepID=UPI0021E3D282
MKTGLKPVLWSFAALLLLLSLVLPLLNMFTLLLLMVPYVVLYTTLPPKSFVLHLIPVWAIAFFVSGPATLIIGLFFLIPSVVMGHLYMKQAPASRVIRTVGVVFLAQLMLELLVFEVFLDISLIREMGQIGRDTVNNLQSQNMLPSEWNSDFTETVISMIVNSIPMTFIMIAFGYTVITQYIARRAVKWSGGPEVPRFTSAREWRLPRILVMIYLIAYAVELLSSPAGESFFSVAVMNLVPLLSFVFAFQAVGFFFFLAHERGWNKAVPVLIAIPVLMFPPLSLIGVLDTAFPIRKSFTKP